jgi:hypothetical protein
MGDQVVEALVVIPSEALVVIPSEALAVILSEAKDLLSRCGAGTGC